MKYPVAFVLALSSCSPPHTLGPTAGRHTVRLLFCGDQAFSDTEREQIVTAMDNWRKHSDGHIRMGVVWGCNVEPVIWRRQKDDEATLRTEARLAKVYNVPEMKINGWQSDRPAEIHLVVNGVDLRKLAEHELGHAAGLWWPGCKDLPNVCAHSYGNGHLMSRYWIDAAEFDECDRDLCRASGLCR